MAPRRRMSIALSLFSAFLVAACQEQARGPRTQPAEPDHRSRGPLEASRSGPPTAATQPVTAASPTVDGRTAPSSTVPRIPKRPKNTWAIFREAFDRRADVSCIARWTGGNRIEIRTENIRRLTIDLTKLPEGAPAKGPWNLQIDGQGIEMTGFRPKPGYTGLKRDLIRSQNGNWTVDRKRLYRLGE